MRSMSGTRAEILEAAMRVFARYGVRRSSMRDVAEEAGVSRQTLYNAFGSKDDLLRALIRHFTDQAIARIEAGLPACRDLGEQLDLVFAHMVVEGFELVRRTPNAAELLEGFNHAGRDEIATAAARFTALIERILAPHAPALAHAGLTPGALAAFVQRAAKAVGAQARGREELTAQLATLRRLCRAAAGQPEGAQAAPGPD